MKDIAWHQSMDLTLGNVLKKRVIWFVLNVENVWFVLNVENVTVMGIVVERLLK